MPASDLSGKPIAIIPARGGSKRVPRKNIADLNGQPLVSYAIQTCLAVGIFDRVVVSTEDAEIADVARQYGAVVDMRPDDLATDRVPATAVIKELIERDYSDANRPDHFCLVYPMAAFLTADDLISSHQKLAQFDGVMGVSHFTSHPYKAMVDVDGALQPLWPDLNAQQSQNYPDAFASNGTFCWMRTAVFLDCLSFYPPRLHGHVLPDERAVDIDTPEDLARARRYMALAQ